MAGILNLFIGVSGVVRDAFFNLVTLLIPSSQTQFWNSDASTNKFNLVVNGNTTPTAASPYYTMWSTYFDGSGDSFSVSTSTVLDLNGAIDFTIEAWVYLTGYGSSADMSLNIANKFTGAGGLGYTYGIFGGGANQGKIQFYGAAGSVSIISTNAVPLNSWNHVAIVKNGTTYTHYLNGVANGSQTTATTLTASANALVIGDYGYSDDFLGYMSNLRITKNGAVYTSGFTPPTSPLTTSVSAGTVSLLTFQSNRFVDNSSNGFTLTPSGTPSVSSFAPFTEASQTYGSGYFDGSGDSLSVASNAAFALGTGDFTLEFWLYPTSTTQRNITFPTVGAPIFYMNASSQLQFENYGATPSITTTNTLQLNAWNHCVASRVSGTTRLFINGVQGVSSTAFSATNFVQSSVNIGADVSTTFCNGYMSDVRIVKGTAVYTENFTPPTAPLTAVANTSLLTLQYALSNNSSGFIDQSINRFPLTRNGNVAQGAFSPYSQTGWSNFFDGSGDYLSNTSTALITNAVSTFTVESWVYFTATPPANGNFISSFCTLDGQPTGPTNFMSFGPLNDGKLYLFWFDGSVKYASGNTVLALNTWYHIACVVNSNSIQFYVNGIPEVMSNTTTLTNRSGSQGNFAVASSSGGQITGYISNFRVTTTAVYTSTFAPSTTPLTPITGTVLLTCQSNRFIDTNTQVAAKALTVNGTPSVQAFSPFAPTAAYTPATVGGSIYQDGSGDYINGVNNQPAMALGSGDWTVECWVYPVGSTTYSGERGFLQISPSSGGLSTSYSNGIFLGFRNTTGVYYGVNGSLPVGGTTSLNQWLHIAMTRASGTVRGWLNGVQVASYSETSTITGNNLVIGGYYNTSYLLNGYISDVRIVKGTAVYTGTFTPPTAPLSASGAASASAYPSTANVNTSFSSTNTSLLCNFNNAGIYDASTKNNLETFGNGGLSTLQSKFGSASGFYDGVNDYQFVLYNAQIIEWWKTSYTVEYWIYANTLAAASTVFPIIVGHTSISDGTNYWSFGPLADGTIRFYYWNGSQNNIATTATITTGQWYHLAFVNNANSIAIYIDGVQRATGTISGTPQSSTSLGLLIGAHNNVYFNGYLDDLRITYGVARYTANFTPPSAPFPTQ